MAERLLVVEGELTEGPGPHYVNLSWTGAYTQGIDALRPRETGARVSVVSGSGAEIVFSEEGAGRYATAPGELVGAVGETYTLQILTRAGDRYASPPITMRHSPEVATIHTMLVDSYQMVGDLVQPDHDVLLLVDTERTPESVDYFRWRWRGTAAVNVCNNLGCSLCYHTVEGPVVANIGHDALVEGDLLQGQRVAAFPLSQHGIRFLHGFHITVEQQAITPDAFAFWSVIHSHLGVGNLFDSPPETVWVNVVHLDDPSRRTLGYFTVAGLSRAETCTSRHAIEGYPPPTPPLTMWGMCGGNIPGSTNPPPGFVAACQPASRP